MLLHSFTIWFSLTCSEFNDPRFSELPDVFYVLASLADVSVQYHNNMTLSQVHPYVTPTNCLCFHLERLVDPITASASLTVIEQTDLT